MPGFERRYSDRLPVNNAKIKYYRQNGIVKTVKLLDLTKSSARFATKDKLKIGEIINIDIIIPGMEVLNIKGTVIRNSDENEKTNPYSVITFFPYGTNDNYNSLVSLNQINEILEIKFFEI